MRAEVRTGRSYKRFTETGAIKLQAALKVICPDDHRVTRRRDWISWTVEIWMPYKVTSDE